MGYMYILKCADGTFYVGSTRHLEARVWQHSTGEGATYTKERLPVELVYHERYPRIVDAFAREKQIQNWSHAKRAALIAGDFDALRRAGKKKFPDR